MLHLCPRYSAEELEASAVLELDSTALLELDSTTLELDSAMELELAAEEPTELELAVESAELELLGGTSSSTFRIKSSMKSPLFA